MSKGAPPESDDLADKVRGWLETEGYPLEFKAADIFERAGFRVIQGEYTEADGDAPRREIDLTACIDRFEGRLLRVEHVVECKWAQNKPWVLFCSGHGITTAACVTQTIGSELAELLLWKEAGHTRLEEFQLFNSGSASAFGGRQAFSVTRDVLFDAIRAVISNCRSVADEYDRDPRQIDRAPAVPPSAAVVLPVIVVDGRLFEARHSESGLELNEVARARVHWRGAERHRFAHATLDIVTLDHLPEFVARRASETSELLDLLSGSLWEVIGRFEAGTIDLLSVTSGARGTTGIPPLLVRLIEEQRAGVLAGGEGEPRPDDPPLGP